MSAAGMADAVGNTGALITKADLVLTENGKLESDVCAIMSTNRDGRQFLLKNKAGICAHLCDVTGPLSPPMSLTSDVTGPGGVKNPGKNRVKKTASCI